MLDEAPGIALTWAGIYIRSPHAVHLPPTRHYSLSRLNKVAFKLIYIHPHFLSGFRWLDG